MKVHIRELTRIHIRGAKNVCVDNSDGTVTVVRRWRGVLPFVTAESPGLLLPEDLIVHVPQGAGDPLLVTRAAMEYLGYQCDVLPTDVSTTPVRSSL